MTTKQPRLIPWDKCNTIQKLTRVFIVGIVGLASVWYLIIGYYMLYILIKP